LLMNAMRLLKRVLLVPLWTGPIGLVCSAL